MTETCTHLIELFKAEEPFLNQEYILHKWFRSQEKHKEIGIEEAKLDYVNTHMINWATGFAWVYCPFCCEGEECGSYNSKQKKFNDELKNIQKLKDVSFDEAEQIYISELGPSFWKGATDAIIYIKSKKSLLQNSLNSSDTRA